MLHFFHIFDGFLCLHARVKLYEAVPEKDITKKDYLKDSNTSYHGI